MALIVSPSPFYLGRPQRRQVLIYYTAPIVIQRAESAQTLQVKVQRPVPIDAIHSRCGLPMCAVAGLELRLSREHTQKHEASALCGAPVVEDVGINVCNIWRS